jgi:acetylornithine/N-succinyldiaminopimelate aminotransferase
MMELVQGEGGVMPLDYEFVQQVKALCEENDWLLCIDEVQTGIGRTGSLMAFQQYDILPDVAVFAKGIAGGLPMSGMLANEKCRKVLTPGTHATTFGGNPIAAAAALAVQDILSDEVLEEVKAKGAYLRKKIETMGSPAVSGTRGLGLMVGITLNQGYVNKELAGEMISAGLLVLTAGQNVIRLLPPLTISYEEIDRGLAIMKQVLCK